MKRSYESPLMSIELFMANQAVSACTAEGGIDWTFDCMAGPNTDTTKVISTQIPGVTATCGLNIGYASGILTARDYDGSSNHSNNNRNLATWTTGKDDGKRGDSYLQVKYSGGQGILFTDGNASIDSNVWTIEDGYVKHAKKGGGMHHMVAPVMNTQTINASW